MSVLRAIAAFLCGLLSLQICTAQVVESGPCPNIAPMDPFDASRYLGKWYEYEKYFAIFEAGGKCITATYNLTDNNEWNISVLNKQINIYTGLPGQIKGQAKQESPNPGSKLLVRFSSQPLAPDAPYWVVDSDFDNYSLVWSCLELGSFHSMNSWILTRQREPSDEIVKKVYDIVKDKKINAKLFLRTDQKNCPEDA